MSHFYASIQGSRGEATRCGAKNSGIAGHIRGWSSGVYVRGFHDYDGKDKFHIFATGGSGRYGSHCIGTVSEYNGEAKFTHKSSEPEMSLMDEIRKVIQRFKDEADIDTYEQNKAAHDLILALSVAEKVLYEEEDD